MGKACLHAWATCDTLLDRLPLRATRFIQCGAELPKVAPPRSHLSFLAFTLQSAFQRLIQGGFCGLVFGL